MHSKRERLPALWIQAKGKISSLGFWCAILKLFILNTKGANRWIPHWYFRLEA